MSIEIMLNAVNLVCGFFQLSSGCSQGQYLFSMVVAAAAAVGLAMNLF
jgi:NADH:ubiquinone oxidoreductase subunit K